MKSVLTITRHGQTPDNAEGRWQGRREGALTPEGRRQIEALGQRLKLRRPYRVIYSSPLARGVETATLLACTLGEPPVETDAQLAEYDLGAGARLIVVGHGLTLAAALGLLLDGDARRAPRYALGNGGMAELVLEGRSRLIHLDPVIS